ncbi:MAG: PLP-dependent aspartate aminotransferase family protein [Geminicoccaceae bacterium]
MTPPNRASAETRAVQALHEIEAATGAVVPAIQPSSTFARDADYALRDGFVYSRDTCPTVRHAERIVASLEDGAAALLFGSGLAACATLFETVPAGKRIAAPRIMYHGVQDWLVRLRDRRGIGLDFFDAADPASLAAAVHPGETALLWLETPVNPSWDVIDIEAAAAIGHAAGALVAVDGTCASPVTTQALNLGADIVFHSATKYLNGHSDLTAGVLVTKVQDESWRELTWLRSKLGGVLGAFEAWLLIRGMRTLYLRFERASASALAIARHLEGHPAIERVLYPGLESHAQHAIARRQMTRGFGGMLSILVHGGPEAAKRIASATRLFLPATSLGGVESLIEHRKAVEGPNSIVPGNLLRLSVGIEDVGDLIADLDAALGTAR